MSRAEESHRMLLKEIKKLATELGKKMGEASKLGYLVEFGFMADGTIPEFKISQKVIVNLEEH